MSEYIGENFQQFEDHNTYFLTQDALKPLEYDLYFSPTKKYYCNANCNVCYIKNKLNEGLPFYKNVVPEVITDKQTRHWLDIFEYFYVIRTNDDLTYLKKNYPIVFDWYREHAAIFEFGMTDNAIISQHNVLMNDLNLKGLADVSMSDHFLNRVNAKKNYNKVMEILQDYMDKYGLCKIKIIRTEEGELEDHVYELVEWLNSKGVKNCLQADLRVDRNERFELENLFEYQNTYTMNSKGISYQIYRESIHLYNDRFFYSIDDATDINEDPFHIMEETFSPERLISDMLKVKQDRYRRFGNQLTYGETSVVDKFKRYYINSSDMFTVNGDFNFIPKFMLSDKSKFYSKMVERGYKVTEVGLYRPSEAPRSIVDFKEK